MLQGLSIALALFSFQIKAEQLSSRIKIFHKSRTIVAKHVSVDFILSKVIGRNVSRTFAQKENGIVSYLQQILISGILIFHRFPRVMFIPTRVATNLSKHFHTHLCLTSFPQNSLMRAQFETKSFCRIFLIRLTHFSIFE